MEISKIFGNSFKVEFTEIPSTGFVKAYCNIVIDGVLIIHECKIILNSAGELQLFMPSREAKFHCENCKEKNKVSANFCNKCGQKLHFEKYRIKIKHYDFVHPTCSEFRNKMVSEVLKQFNKNYKS